MRTFARFSVALCLAACAISCGGNKISFVEGGSMKVAATVSECGAAEVRTLLERGRMAVDSIRRPVLGKAAHDLEKYIPESPLMNFAADALLQMARETTGQHVDVAITNKGGLRSNIAAGEVTFGDVYNVFPFENTLALLTLSGEQLMQLCSEIASVGGEAASGMTILITADGKLFDVKVGGRSVDRSRSYRVATSDYLSQGNDKMTALASGTEREVMSNITIRDLMINYIRALASEGKPLSAKCDGRITIKE